MLRNLLASCSAFERLPKLMNPGTADNAVNKTADTATGAVNKTTGAATGGVSKASNAATGRFPSMPKRMDLSAPEREVLYFLPSWLTSRWKALDQERRS